MSEPIDLSSKQSHRNRSKIGSVVTLVAIGTICWVSAGVVALAAGAESKVLWTCFVGALLGLVGIRYSIRRNRKSSI
jgi:CHASE2 domain-containing sensor protein